jgi:hypothetical protein
MNLDPMKWCNTCRKPKPRDTFRQLPGKSNRGPSCGDCYTGILASRKKIREAGKKKDLTPF